MNPFTLAIALASLALAQQASAGERYEGVAYARGTTSVLYRETHWQYDHDGIGRHLVLYRCPDGKAFARKLLRLSPSSTAPDFDFVDGRDGHREGVRTQGGKREAYVQESTGAPVKTEAIDVPADGVIDAGFDAAVRQRWQSLAAGKAATIPFLLPSRHGFLPLQLAQSKQGRAANEPVLELRMSLARWYGFALPAIELVYGLDDRRLMEFHGIGSIRGRDGDYLDVRIVFPAGRVVDQAGESGIAAARSAPLDGQCAD
ncbi:MAG: hypothetical protein L0H23_01695 [Luteimonas sp.]|nr:hypothetical protein [Luteimonas sp.]